MPNTAPSEIAENWLARFSAALAESPRKAVEEFFLEDCYWRDLLAFTWNIKTMEGRDAVIAMLEATLASASPTEWHVSGEPSVDGDTIEAWFTFETGVARCEGVARLRGGRCWTMFTAIRDLKAFPEKKGATRPLGIRHKADPDRETWSETKRRWQAELGTSRQPDCLVIGGGQGGIALGARLKQLDVPTLIVEQNERAGDSWRRRYRSLVLHDPVWYDHLPYIPFPDHWPVFTPKDKMGDWLEMYVKVMELDYWTSTRCVSAFYEAGKGFWTVELDRGGERVEVKPRQLVFATGAYGPPRAVELPGMESFAGEILHSSRYSDGSRFRGKDCVVIGAASSAHDVAVDLWEAGANVTMIQRSPTTVVRSDTLMEVGFETYSERAVERGMTVDKADTLTASMPFALVPAGQKVLYDLIRARDRDFYRRLSESGFLLDFGHDETGLLMKAYRTGSGYYIDVGACDLIMDGKIRVRSGQGISFLTPTGVVMEDGEEIRADAVIACIGYYSMHETVAGIVSRETADRIGPCWGLGSGTRGDPGPWQGELRNMWKPTAQEALWFHGGNLALSRYYSKFVALQIKARVAGINTPVYGAPSG
ncbi:NAD(P)/FAD-dependent oxidoreductase [Mesorhizobium sp. GR13]|uniref:NAD(P)/FAD-dependent oxidoreductase n=1 Tax=Mesorhizobium sp. GR13 TaxID=2562308 RepID=UPI0010C12427|nr:NAD(P)/FAD-dependent oxidoreductase [Mesorhizobium sp. GR13]